LVNNAAQDVGSVPTLALWLAFSGSRKADKPAQPFSTNEKVSNPVSLNVIERRMYGFLSSALADLGPIILE
jgi:hypothetical protein